MGGKWRRISNASVEEWFSKDLRTKAKGTDGRWVKDEPPRMTPLQNCSSLHDEGGMRQGRTSSTTKDGSRIAG